jgi:hypothetical protein
MGGLTYTDEEMLCVTVVDYDNLQKQIGSCKDMLVILCQVSSCKDKYYFYKKLKELKVAMMHP